jgi:hypothetical protein
MERALFRVSFFLTNFCRAILLTAAIRRRGKGQNASLGGCLRV